MNQDTVKVLPSGTDTEDIWLTDWAPDAEADIVVPACPLPPTELLRGVWGEEPGEDVLTAGGDGVLRLEFIDKLREEDWDADSDGLGEGVELPMLDRTNSSNNMATSSDLDNNICKYGYRSVT